MKRLFAAAVVLGAALIALSMWMTRGSDGDDLPVASPVIAVATAGPSVMPSERAATPSQTIAPSPAAATESPTPAASLSDPLGWAAMSRREFGCMVERETGTRDRLWNCDSTEDVPDADPCRDPQNFYRGPQLPPELAARVSSLAERVELHWEGGAVQQIDLVLKEGVDERAARDAFAIPPSDRPSRDGVDSATVTECVPGHQCVVVKANARAQVDCGDGRQPD